MSHRIERGQEYLACKPTPSMPGEHYTRIRVIKEPGVVSGKPVIATLWADGSTSNVRSIDPRKLHETGHRKDGRPRISGYRLVRHADGTATEGAQR